MLKNLTITRYYTFGCKGLIESAYKNQFKSGHLHIILKRKTGLSDFLYCGERHLYALEPIVNVVCDYVTLFPNIFTFGWQMYTYICVFFLSADK